MDVKKGGQKEGEETGRDNWKVAFWNIAGLVNKDGEFWKRLKEWEVMVLIETWVEEKNWRKVREKLPRGYEWNMQRAEKGIEKEEQWREWR